jgi:four helix bundle protein
VANSFRELLVWQKSMQLAVGVYGLTKGFPREEIYGMTSQMRRCAASIPSNIAEGQGRANVGEFRQVLAIARGSCCELQTQLDLARALGLGSRESIEDAGQLSDEIRKMLFGLLQSLNDRSEGRRSHRGLRTVN